MLDIGSWKEQNSGDFELVVQVRDSQGNPTGRTKSLRTDKSDKIAAFWFKTHGQTKKKNKTIVKSIQPDKILNEINEGVPTNDV